MLSCEGLEKKLDLLVKFGGLIHSETRLDQLLTLVADQVRTILNCDRCTIFLLDTATNELWSKVAHGIGQTEIRIPSGTGIAGITAKTGKIINIPDAYAENQMDRSLDQLTGYKTKTILAVPLKNHTGDILGVFEVLNKLSEKPFDSDDEGILLLLGSVISSAVENAKLYDTLRKSQLETIYRLAITAEYRDQHDTATHLRHISNYSHILAQAMNLPEDHAQDIKYASPLHDIGKVAISDSILLKPAKLTPEEFEEMKKHTAFGAKILANAESRLLQIACQVAMSHHEKYDGTGYPEKLKGGQIPLEARIVSVADVFDALCMARVYKPGWPPEKTRDYIISESGKAFDPAVVAAFEKSYPEILLSYEKDSRAGKRTTAIPGIKTAIKP